MNWKEHEKKLLKNPDFVKISQGFEPEYQLARTVIKNRLKKGYTQKQIADRMKTSQSAIARVESGNHLPSLLFLKRLSKALGTQLHITLC